MLVGKTICKVWNQKNTGAKSQRNFPQKYVDFFLKTAYNTSTRRCSLYSESHYR